MRKDKGLRDSISLPNRRSATRDGAEASEPFFGFDKAGFLPPGIHLLTMEQAQSLLTVSLDRHYIWAKLSRFMNRKIIDCAAFGAAYLTGNFVSSDPYAMDVDVILESKTNYTHHSIEAMESELQLGLDEIYQEFSVYLHFWAKGCPNILNHPRLTSFSRPIVQEPSRSRKRGIIQIPITNDLYFVS